MIAADAALDARWLPLDRLYYLPDEHGIGLDTDQVRHYVDLLRDPTRATDPIVVVPDGDRYRITNGRHRWIAAHLAGRRAIAAVVVGAAVPGAPPDLQADLESLRDRLMALELAWQLLPPPPSAPSVDALQARLTEVELQLQRQALRAIPAEDVDAIAEQLRADIAVLRSHLIVFESEYRVLAARILFPNSAAPRA